MRKLIWLIVLIVVTPLLAAAQSPEGHAVQGYLFAAPGYGFEAPNVHFGVGVDGLVSKRVGVGAEVGYLGFTRSNLREGFGVFSPNVSYHFINGRTGKFDPFVTGGYSLAFRQGVGHAGNFGGGVNYWFKDRLGLRFEVRDHVVAFDREAHLVGFRFGVTFR